MNATELLSMIRGDLLRRSDTDPSLPDATVYRALNIARRAIWSELVGSDTQTVVLDIVANQETYPLDPWTPERVLSVSVKDTDDVLPRRLPPVSNAGLLSTFPNYPASDGMLTVYGYQVRMWASVQSVSDIWGDPMLVSSQTSSHGYVVKLWPAPSVNIDGGLVVEIVGKAADLSDAFPESALPDEVDIAATYRAAIALSPRLGYDQTAALWLPELKSQGREAFNRAKTHTNNLSGGPLTRLRTTGFGRTRPGRWSDTPSPFGMSQMAVPTPVVAPVYPNAPSPLWAHVDAVPVAGATSITVDLDALVKPRVRAGSEEEVRAISQDTGEIFDIDASVLAHITATLRFDPITGAQFTFGSGDLVRFWYPI